MGQRGPAPRPTALRLLQGGASSRGVNEKEPKPPIPEAAPEPPIYLQGLARREWKRVIPDLYGTGCYTNLDETMLAAYCLAYQTWRHAEEMLQEERDLDEKGRGLVETTKNGNRIHSPLLGVAAAARRDMARLAAQFGLTPSSRTGIEAGKAGEGHDPARRYFD